eukprot:TRINITY_DN9206_c0_g1_i1.p1 TRINITY_DN9206_c0_g1~~TRINITY_DN9206_c0_g1_i1.p1  ORF type:complete len:177 (+),score=38.51 TRINITY_DN9206_c0_g1_i1:90-620(+)
MSEPEKRKVSDSGDAKELPDGWIERMSRSTGRKYYWHAETQTTQWKRPKRARGKKRAKVLSQVQASHLLIKHCESRRPSSWKSPSIVRSKEEARMILHEHEDALRAFDVSELPHEFAALAKVHSDCNSAKHGGDLGPFKRGAMQPSFEEAAFALEVGEMSRIVESQSGYHLILRTK